MRRNRLTLVLAATLIASLTAPTAWASHSVTATCADLQSVLDGSHEGQVITLQGVCTTGYVLKTGVGVTLQGDPSDGEDGFDGGATLRPLRGVDADGTVISDLVFRNGSEDLTGAAIDLTDTWLTIRRSTFLNNYVDGFGSFGGAVDIEAGAGETVTLVDNLFRGNHATSSTFQALGGAVRVVFTGGAGTVVQRRNTFDGNSVSSSGDDENGGAFGSAEHLVNANLDSLDDRFINNVASHTLFHFESGPVHIGTTNAAVITATLRFENAEFVANEVGDAGVLGSAIHSRYFDVQLEDSTVAGNLPAGALPLYVREHLDVENTIVWSGAPTLPDPVYGTRTVRYSLMCDSAGQPVTGEGNLCADPELVDTGPGTTDVRQRRSSPTIDAGNDSLVPTSLDHDFEGDARIMDGDGDGTARVDMGADEYRGPVDLAVDVADSRDPVSVGDPFAYVVTVSNRGLNPAAGLALTIRLPAEVDVREVESPGTGCSLDDAVPPIVSCDNDAPLAAGDQLVVTVHVRATADGDASCVAHVTSEQDESTPGDNADAEVTRIVDAAAPPADLTTRLSGPGRVDTAVAIARDSFADGAAGAVVLARSDNYPDALAGTPFAVAEDAPILLSNPASLDAATEAELQRVLPRGRTVYILGGQAALSEAVASRIADLGYQVDRISGPTRIETALAIAGRLGHPDVQLITTGFNFADALGAGAAAVVTGGAVVLTTPDTPHPATDEYLDAHPGTRYAIGGPAARAYPAATAIAGTGREATAVAVAERFFAAPPVVGIARADDYPDALTGGTHIARRGGPMLLTATHSLDQAVAGWLCDHADTLDAAFVFGGEAAVDATVLTAIDARIAGEGC